MVQDATGSPLIGASVYVVGTTTGTVSDANGRFSIKMNEGQQLQISLVGYNPVTISDFNNPNLIINMEPSMTALEQVVVVGTRRANRIQTETPVPVDVLQVSQMQFPTAKMDITSMLNFAAPSFNYAKQSGSDGADHIDLGTPAEWDRIKPWS